MTRSWFAHVFTYAGPNHALLGFYNAIELVLETGFAVTAFVTLVLNLVLPEELEDEAELPELTAANPDEEADGETDRVWGGAIGRKELDAEAGRGAAGSKGSKGSDGGPVAVGGRTV